MPSPKQLTEELKSYICDNSYNYAVMINSQWGTGKTYYILKGFLEESQTLIEEKDMRPVYVSLFDCYSIEEVKNKTMWSYVAKLPDTASDKVIKILNKVTTLIEPVCNKLEKQLIGDTYTAGLSNALSSVIEYQNCLFIIDDVERCKYINTEDLLGFINNLVEHGKNKVIMICDESHIDDSTYKEQKEKVIGITYDFELNLQSVITKIITTLECDEKYKHELLEAKADDIYFREMQSNGIRNVRTFRFMLSRTLYVLPLLANKFETYTNDINKFVVEQIAIYSLKEKHKDLELSPGNNSSKALNEFVRTGYLNKELLFDELAAYVDNYLKYKIDNDDPVMLLYYEWHKHDSQWVNEQIDILKDNINNKKYDYMTFPRIIDVLLVLKHYKYLPDINEFKNLFKKIITDSDDDLKLYTSEVYIVANELIENEFKVEINELNGILEKKLKNKYANKVDEILDCDDWSKCLNDYFVQVGAGYVTMRNTPVFSKTTAEKWLDTISNSSITQLDQFRTFLQRYAFNATDYNKNEDENTLKTLHILIEPSLASDVTMKNYLLWIKNDIARYFPTLELSKTDIDDWFEMI